MAKIKKQGTSGAAKNYITRSQAVRKLQISLPDFRRLCIWKGIYPREPRNKKKVSKRSTPSTTFYYAKDIQYLLHEPILQKFRDHKALTKKIARALGKGEVKDAARLEKTHKPRMTLNHIIKERYPTFDDALRDLDDALSMLFLFANLPSTSTAPPKTIALCQRLCLEFEHYLITTHSLRKSFLSIKGIYYQATIRGQDVLWLVPYKFVQRITGDVDFRIMGTFVDFYTTLLGFVNFKLYSEIGLVYPPKFDASSDEKGGELSAYTLEGKTSQLALENGTSHTNGTEMADSSAAQAEADKLAQSEIPTTDAAEVEKSDEPEGQPAEDAIDTFETTADDADILPQPQASSSEAASLFADFTVFLSRETPRAPLEFLLKAFGCKRVGWDIVLGDGAFTNNEADTSITHQIVDRPNLPAGALPEVPEANGEMEGAAQKPKPGARIPGRTYVQPQWVWDCANQGKLLRPDLYAPGATLPPHMSPWVKPKKGEYDPTAPLAEQEREDEAVQAELDAEIQDEEGDEESDGVEEEAIRQVAAAKAERAAKHRALLERDAEVQPGEGMEVDGSEPEDSEEDEDEAEDEDDFGGFSDDEEKEDAELSDTEATRLQQQDELEAEASGVPIVEDAGSTPGKALKARKEEVTKKAARKKRAEEEELERQKMMMPRRKRKLFEKMQYSNQKTEAEAEKLRGKRRKLERRQGVKV